jgi:hypothetical protein
MNSFYNSDRVSDVNLDPEFVMECRDHTKPIAVIGNGGSIENLADDQIDTINSCRLFRCNWAFRDPSKIKKQYAMYFSQAYGAGVKGAGEDSKLVDMFNESANHDQVSFYRMWTQVCYSHNPMTSLVAPDRCPVWPTTGIQMLAHASFYIPSPSIYIAGVDMYMYKRPKRIMNKKDTLEYLKKYGKTFSLSADNSAGTSLFKENLSHVTPDQWKKLLKEFKATKHYIEVDILLLFQSFAQCILNNREIHILGNPALLQLYNIVCDNMDLMKQFFNTTSLHSDDEKIKPCVYNMWRLINNTMIQVLPD